MFVFNQEQMTALNLKWGNKQVWFSPEISDRIQRC